VKDVIGKDIYKGMDADNQQSTVMNLLVAHENMDDKTAYNIVKTFFDKREELIRAHKEAENIKLENQKTEASPIPWHPGAVKYYAEKGIKIK
jgi:TRAP transporter TAXI family solute receptor